MSREIHPIEPLFDGNSRILILGSFPSVKSRETGFFYGHPQNRFWKVLAAIFNEKIPETIQEKKALALRNAVALWDVIESCEIRGSSDSSIKDVRANDLNIILDSANIQKIFCNGKTSEKLYNKYIYPKNNRSAFVLPSTSPANAAWSLDQLIKTWKDAILS